MPTPTPTKQARVDVKFFTWQAKVTITYYPSYAVAEVPCTRIARGGWVTLCYRERKIAGADYDTLLSLNYEDEIADFFGYRSRQ